MRTALLPQPVLSVVITVVWVLLVNDFTVGTVVLGAALGMVIPLITSRWWPDRPTIRFGPTLLAYFAVVMWDIVVANVKVAYTILFRANRNLRSRWLAVPLELRKPEAIAVLAGTITLTPGTVSCDLSACGRTLLVHALDVPDEAGAVADIKRRYEARLLRIFA